ncbi:hypothetical protein ASD55_07470 [Rhodanobacter sp. Root561]|uniref:hypothetical protein n=1 Tax=Rhodanobacter sp. Root561 TaxID=1736560 RepID=UPI0006F33CA5|nr:hypothetical protein [Rhodanobacter sp. Root561]KQZ77694.1 hypothetical protein ASD55_07470 [Rhodanobacter sp. Root561]
MTSLDRVVDTGEEQRTKPGIAAVGATDRPGSIAAKRTAKRPLASSSAAISANSTLKPDQIAFLGEHAAHHKATAATAFVQVLCWPTLPDAWPRLTRSCAALVAVRTDMFSSGAVPVARSWVQGVAPQLSLPFSRDAGAEESTLATLIARLPARLVATVVEPDREKGVVSDLVLYRRSLSGCLAAYEAFLKDAHESARGVLIAHSRKGTQGENLTEAFKEARDRLDDDSSLNNLKLRFWSEPALPLPLEIANLAAAAISRYLEAPKQANPIFDAVASKLVNPPTCLESRKRR